jgi:hypothetical protein
MDHSLAVPMSMGELAQARLRLRASEGSHHLGQGAIVGFGPLAGGACSANACWMQVIIQSAA